MFGKQSKREVLQGGNSEILKMVFFFLEGEWPHQSRRGGPELHTHVSLSRGTEGGRDHISNGLSAAPGMDSINAGLGG